MEYDTPAGTRKGPDWSEIMSIAAMRQQENSPIMAQMREIRDRYNGDIVYPWAEQIAGGQDMPNLTPHLVGEAIDNYGLRAASVMPALFCPATFPNAEQGSGSREWARTRRRFLAATLSENRFELQARRFMRHLSGYSVASVIIEPDFVRKIPRFKIVNPMNTYPDPKAAEDYTDPVDCIYIHGYSASWLRNQYPSLRSENGGPLNASQRGNDLWDMISYIDGEVMVYGLAGKRTPNGYAASAPWSGRAMEVSRIENRMGMFPGVAMARVTLDRIGSSLSHVMGQLDWAARLQLLDVVATEKAIYPDTYILSDSNRVPILHNPGGQWVDGRTGQANIVTDAQAIGQLRNTPDPAGKQSIDRMERNIRTSTGLAAQFGGETTNALRTGRGIDTMIGASVDPRVHEMQQIAQAWLPHAFKAILACWEAYWPDNKITKYSFYPGDPGLVTCEPGKHIGQDTKEVGVSYPIAGGDLQLTNIALSQMLGAQAISKRTFRERHPWIDDAEGEERRVMEEQLEQIAFQSMANQAMAGQIPLEQLALIEKQYKKGTNADIFTAITNAVAELKEIQAKQAAEAPPELAAPPEQMPGLGGPTGPMAAPAGPMETGQAAIGPSSGMEGLRELQNALAAGGRRVTGVGGPQ